MMLKKSVTFFSLCVQSVRCYLTHCFYDDVIERLSLVFGISSERGSLWNLSTMSAIGLSLRTMAAHFSPSLSPPSVCGTFFQ